MNKNSEVFDSIYAELLRQYIQEDLDGAFFCKTILTIALHYAQDNRWSDATRIISHCTPAYFKNAIRDQALEDDWFKQDILDLANILVDNDIIDPGFDSLMVQTPANQGKPS